MAAAYRGRKAAYQRRKRLWQTRSRKIQTRRKKLRSRQKKRARTQRAVRFVRSRYQPKRNTTTRYYDRRLRHSVFSRQKARYPARSYSRKTYCRKPRRVGRPRKQKRCRSICPRYLHTTLKRTARKKQAKPRYLHTTLKRAARKKQTNPTRAAVIKRTRRGTRNNEDEIFYRMANTSTLEGMPEEKQSKKHLANQNNTRSKETELHSQEDSVDNQPSQQPVVPKKRGRNSAAPVHKSR